MNTQDDSDDKGAMSASASTTSTTTTTTTTMKRSSSPGAAAMLSAATANAAAHLNAAHTLKTPLSATYPSSLHSPNPASATPSYLKIHGDPKKTPLTPPSSYMDFLRVLSPNPLSTNSPLSTGTSTHFSYNSANSPRWPSSAAWSAKSLSPRPRASSLRSSASATPSSTTSAASSYASSAALSAASGSDTSVRQAVSAPPATPAPANTSKPMHRLRPLLPPTSNPRQAVTSNSTSSSSTTAQATLPPRPQSARLGPPPRRPSLIIPPSPTSSITTMSPTPHSQHSAPAASAYPDSAHPNTARPSSAVNPFSRSPIGPDGKSSSTTSPVTIRHVVTRTVTYHRPAGQTSAGPINKGKAPAHQPQPPPTHNTTARSPAASRSAVRLRSPLSAVERAPGNDDDEEEEQRPLVGEVPRSKRRKVEHVQ